MWPFFKKSDIDERDMEWLIVGLGNPGKKYADTRHNAGAMVLEAVARRADGEFDSWSDNKKLKGRVAKGRLGGAIVVLLFPQTYMNLSGDSVQATANFYKIPPERVLAVFDDKEIPLGQLRLRAEGGHGGHNGVKSIIERLGTQNFPRLRVGIGTEISARTSDAASYVLGKPNNEEKAALEEAVGRAASAVETVINEGLDSAMNRFN